MGTPVLVGDVRAASCGLNVPKMPKGPHTARPSFLPATPAAGACGPFHPTAQDVTKSGTGI
jgi:hypothetical protein